MDKSIIERAISYIEGLFKDDCGGHDAAHSLRVYKNAMLIADTEPGCDRRIVALAALLHDADDHKLFDTVDNANAVRFLRSEGIPDDETERICAAINSVSFSRNRGKKPETLEGMIVQDADRLDAIGAIGIARAFAWGGEHGRALEGSVEHFHEKLLLLKDSMNTEAAGKEAEKRHLYLEDFLKELEEETGIIPEHDNI